MKTQLSVLLVSVLALASAGQEIQSYSVSKEHPSAGVHSDPGGGLEVNSAPIHWTAPAGWEELAPTGVRLGSFLAPGPGGTRADVAVTSFPGSVGTELDNVNRWRMELGLPEIGPNEVNAETITVDSYSGRLYDIAGPSSRTVVASLPLNGATWFFKMRGETAAVGSAKPAFADFLKSIHFGPATGGVAAGGAMAADPHAGLVAGATSSRPEPQWAAPASWTPSEHGSLVLKSYSVRGEDGREASVAISKFPGDAGGVLANVNRWRGQLGLTPVPESDLSSATASLDVEGGKGVVVDVDGRDGAKPARMIAVMVAEGGHTWFYKLRGDEGVVNRERAGFLSFVQAVRYR